MTLYLVLILTVSLCGDLIHLNRVTRLRTLALFQVWGRVITLHSRKTQRLTQERRSTYRFKRFGGGALEPTVYCDDKPLARMDNGRYFGFQVPAGKHVVAKAISAIGGTA